MPSTTIAKRIWDIFLIPTPKLRNNYWEKLDTPGAGQPGPGEELIRDFSPFDTRHMKRVNKTVRSFETALQSAPDEESGLAAAADQFEDLLANENPDLLYYAFNVFLTHYNGSVNISVPSLTVREPEIVVPSNVPGRINLSVAVGSVEETKLDWFRESPSMNEHHEHWHYVYNGDRVYDRQGEMFFYMHQQMLARYDTERLTDGVERVKPYNDFAKPIRVGYAAGPDERLAGFVDNDRDKNARLPNNFARQQQSWIREINADIDNKQYDPQGVRMVDETNAANSLGSTIEPNENPAARSKNYNGYHGSGHGMIASLNRGVMRTTITAIRDVVFWEWHKGIDNISFKWQERLLPYVFSTDRLPVLLRKAVDAKAKPYSSDIILCSLPGNITSDAGNQVFGGVHWQVDFAKGKFEYTDAGGNKKSIETTDTLSTHMHDAVIKYKSPDNGTPKEYTYRYLHHDPFCYFIRAENSSLQVKKVTVRIFICAEEHVEDRRMWIEMDKFLYELQPQSKTVIFRKDSESSVIRKPAVIDPESHLTSFDPTNIQMNNRACDCGWPYHMLLPKGKKSANGMEFKLMVMLTDADIDMIEKEEDCGAFSFCAARSTEYPDRRPLGYPFNRRFDGNGSAILNTIRSKDNMACRTIFIKHK
ncbi:MAG: Hemocyanin, copper containing domain [Chitinophagaceae bacterium]|nr:Hemocyanin, copper containing domain [Chitinophagaceae bacterium]MDB5222118.1 Hemocyanin, copper containing domain [Chitinophagaceae bacterium]